jgi:GT2 family glycosyltransferase
MPAPTIGVVVLTMGQRPAELARALASLRAQRDVELDVAVVGNGWAPVGLPDGVHAVHLEQNIGIPAGRNAGVSHVTGEFLMFLDDDSWLLDDDFARTAVERLRAHPDIGMLQPRIEDPDRPGEEPRRWIPRLRKRSRRTSSNVFHVGETCLVMYRSLFDDTGGWPGGFWYAHEGIELAWRVWDRGYRVWYEGDLRVGHPVVDQRRHAEFFRLVARNRVWLARRNLRPPFRWVYPLTWLLLDVVRLRRDGEGRRQYLAGWRAGWRGSPWYQHPRRPLRWRTYWRMTRYGRPPVI